MNLHCTLNMHFQAEIVMTCKLIITDQKLMMMTSFTMMSCFDGDENYSCLMNGSGSIRKKPWTKAEDKMLVELVQRHDSYGYW